MERFTIATLFVRRWPIILVVTALVFAAALWSDSQKQTTYFGSFTVTVTAHREYPAVTNLILEPGKTEDLQTAVATTQTWLGDPYYVGKALQNAGISTDGLSLKDYANVFVIEQPFQFSSTFQVQYSAGSSEEQVRNAFQSLRAVLDEATVAYTAKAGDLIIGLAYTDTTVTTTTSGFSPVPIAGLLIGLIFAVVVAAVVERSRS
jgi:hypothetical protein